MRWSRARLPVHDPANYKSSRSTFHFDQFRNYLSHEYRRGEECKQYIAIENQLASAEACNDSWKPQICHPCYCYHWQWAQLSDSLGHKAVISLCPECIMTIAWDQMRRGGIRMTDRFCRRNENSIPLWHTYRHLTSTGPVCDSESTTGHSPLRWIAGILELLPARVYMTLNCFYDNVSASRWDFVFMIQ